jgi:hypothetical protein
MAARRLLQDYKAIDFQQSIHEEQEHREMPSTIEHGINGLLLGRMS